jgi:hypothetical protein
LQEASSLRPAGDCVCDFRKSAIGNNPIDGQPDVGHAKTNNEQNDCSACPHIAVNFQQNEQLEYRHDANSIYG